VKGIDLQELIADAAAKGLAVKVGRRVIVPGDRVVVAAPKAARPKAMLATAAFVTPGTWTIPLRTESEANARAWKQRSARTRTARAAVSKAFGPTLRHAAALAEHYHQGGTLAVTLTRLAPGELDRGNVFSALKATEDAAALILGCDDGDPRWKLLDCLQVVGEVWGVVIHIEAVGGGA
jgi:hypothetical protein